MHKTEMTFSKAYDLVRDISQQVLTKYAAECDRDNRFPIESFTAIKANGLQALLVPKIYGGFGLNFYEYQQCLSCMAQACPSTASAFNMHNIVVGSISNYDLSTLPVVVKQRFEATLASLFQLVVEEKNIFAAATTEFGIGARFSQVRTTYEKNDTGYLLNGKKSFVTMASYADYYLVLANKKLNEEEKSIDAGQWLTYFLVSRTTPGVRVIENWDVLGMRGTASHEVLFDQVNLTQNAVFMGRTGFALAKVMSEPHWVTGGYLGVYLGIMEAIFQFTIDYIKKHSDYTNDTGLAFKPLIQARIGEMFTILYNSRLSVYEAAKYVCNAPTALESHQAIYSAKYFLGENMPKIATMALRTCGGSSIHKKFELERYLRDSCCGGLMPAVSDMCQIFLGQSNLGITNTNIW